MQKIAVIFLSSLYLLVSVGMNIDVHYCHDEVKDIGLFGVSDSCCCPGDNNNVDCCSYESKFLQFYNHGQTISHAPKLKLGLKNIDYTSTLWIYLKESVSVKEKLIISNSGKSPPNQQPIWLVLCSFIFYG